jgi:hypothetical protein
MLNFSVCVLFYGDHGELAKRCLSSIAHALQLDASKVADVRLGMNAVSPASERLIQDFAERFESTHAIPTIGYRTSSNACKYPRMRRMFRDPKLPIGPSPVQAGTTRSRNRTV